MMSAAVDSSGDKSPTTTGHVDVNGHGLSNGPTATTTTTTTTPLSDSRPDADFLQRLQRIVHQLYDSRTYSDIVVTVGGGGAASRQFHAHKFVLEARSDLWTATYLEGRTALDWPEMAAPVGEALMRWLYTGEVRFRGGAAAADSVATELMRWAHEFRLPGLLAACERHVIGVVTVRNCVHYYTLSMEVHGEQLRHYCSNLISSRWSDLIPADFEHMPGPLLYAMLAEKTNWPLHTAVRLQRDDVVLLWLGDMGHKTAGSINRWGPDGELPLEMALRQHNLTMARTLLKHNANINAIDGNGDTLLHRAVRHEDEISVNFLIEHDCNGTCTTRMDQDGVLHLIAGTRNLAECQQIAMRLIEKYGLDVNAPNRLGLTPLHVAIQCENVAIFNTLLTNAYTDLNRVDTDEHSPLFYALRQYHQSDCEYQFAEELLSKHAEQLHLSQVYGTTGNNLLQTLICVGAVTSCNVLMPYLRVEDVNYVNATTGESSLHLACRSNDRAPIVAKLLAMPGIQPNQLTYDTHESAVHYAVTAQADQCIEVLVSCSAAIAAPEHHLPATTSTAVDFNVRDHNGDTPISLAFNIGCADLIPLLIRGGADINVRNAQDLTLFHQAIIKQDAQIALFLLENGADMNAKTVDSETALQLAIHSQLVDVVEALCLRGVDMSTVDQHGNCPLWMALAAGHEDVAHILVRHGVDTDFWAVGPDRCSQTLLHRAIDENLVSAAIFLIQSGCELDEPRRAGGGGHVGDGGDAAASGSSPLHLCCEWGLTNVARTLIEHRANINSRDANNKTPICIAIENQHTDLIALLLSVPEIDLCLKDRNALTPFAIALATNNLKAAEMVHEKMPSAAEQYDNKGYNFLHRAIINNELVNALFLLSLHVDVNARVQDSMCTPALHLAAKHSNETIIRSLILMGAWVDERDARKRTAIHVASQAGNSVAVLALLHNNVDYQALDAENDNALQMAVHEGHLNVVRTLLSECNIDAECVNLKGRNALHTLCRFGGDTAAAIFELFIETMPKYPIDQTDVNGNSPLLLAYMNGNGNLCRALVRATACLATENVDKVSIFNCPVASKQLLHSLLDQLGAPAVWAPKPDGCQECGKPFTITVRTHHCRHCGRALCSRCSDQEVPIVKFGEHKPVRVCNTCFEVLKSGPGGGT